MSAQHTRRNLIAYASLALFAVVGLVGLLATRHYYGYSERRHIYDLIWLDAWALLFFVGLVVIWLAARSWRLRAWMLLASLAIYGIVYTALSYHGTPFGMSGTYGDQQFRLAMILKFVTFHTLSDFYYKDLPSFYPPAYYFLLSLWSWVFSVEAFKMVKIGGMIIYAAGPFLLYLLWRKIVSPIQACLVVLSIFLLCSDGNPFIQGVPHAFLGNSLFVPWWLYYVEGVRARKLGWGTIVAGGVIGALIFSTYFYAFFMLAAFLFIRLVIVLLPSIRRSLPPLRFGRIFAVLGATAALSAPYWFPLMVSIRELGIDRSRGGWHHIGTTGFGMSFMDWSLAGVLVLAGIIYSFMQRRSRLHSLLFLFLCSTIVYLLLGSVLGAIDRPINLIKSREFIRVLGGVFVGLAAAGLLRAFARSPRKRVVLAAVLGVGVLVSLNGANSAAKDDDVKTARQTSVPEWSHLAEWSHAAGKVVLSGDPLLPSFVPVYTFLNTNEHYAHPASRFAARYAFLDHLSPTLDPYVFYLALRHNIFDQVDYIYPRWEGDNFEMLVRPSAYPNRYDNRTLKFAGVLLKDTALFMSEASGRLYRLSEAAATRYADSAAAGSPFDRVLTASALEPYLTPSGKKALREYLGLGDDRQGLRIEGSPADVADFVASVGVLAADLGDNQELTIVLRVDHELDKSYRIFLHRYGPESGDTFENFDFSPEPPTTSWDPEQAIACRTIVPKHSGPVRWHLGLFNTAGRLGPGIWANMP